MQIGPALGCFERRASQAGTVENVNPACPYAHILYYQYYTTTIPRALVSNKVTQDLYHQEDEFSLYACVCL